MRRRINLVAKNEQVHRDKAINGQDHKHQHHYK